MKAHKWSYLLSQHPSNSFLWHSLCICSRKCFFLKARSRSYPLFLVVICFSIVSVTLAFPWHLYENNFLMEVRPFEVPMLSNMYELIGQMEQHTAWARWIEIVGTYTLWATHLEKGMNGGEWMSLTRPWKSSWWIWIQMPCRSSLVRPALMLDRPLRYPCLFSIQNHVMVKYRDILIL